MGYTHYATVLEFEKNRARYADALRRVTADFTRLAPAFPFPLAGPNGTGLPELGPELAFNGLAPYDDYESFYLPTPEAVDASPHLRPDPHLFLFTKTGLDRTSRRPYDLAVMVALVLLKWHLGEGVRIGSDGNLLAWQPATDFVLRNLGYPVDPFFVLDRLLFRAGPVQVEASRHGPDPRNQVRKTLHHWLGLEVEPWVKKAVEQALLEDPAPDDQPPGQPVSENAPLYVVDVAVRG